MSPAEPGTLRGDEVGTRAGSLAVIADEDGTVHAAGYTSLEALSARMPDPASVRRGRLPAGILQAIRAFDAGDLQALDATPVQQPGTEFQAQVWAALRAIPAGQVRTYGELAVALGRPQAARAVGQACARNRIAPFVPCHRAVPASGTGVAPESGVEVGRVGGYAYGGKVKSALLEHERSAR